MIDIGQIWCKLSALAAMVYIHWRTPTFHLERVFNPPPPGRILFEQHLFSVWASLRTSNFQSLRHKMERDWGRSNLPFSFLDQCCVRDEEVVFTPSYEWLCKEKSGRWHGASRTRRYFVAILRRTNHCRTKNFHWSPHSGVQGKHIYFKKRDDVIVYRSPRV